MSDAEQRTGTRAETGARSELLARYHSTYGALAALILLLAFNLLLTPGFLNSNNFRNILLHASPVALVAVGMTFVVATRGLDLSVGAVMLLASAVAVALLGRGVSQAILFALVVAASVGLFNGILIATFSVPPIIITLALLMVGRGAAQIINDGRLIPFSAPPFEYLGQGYVGPLPVQVLLMLVVLVAAIFIMRATVFGRYILAIGGNEAASRLAGIKVRRTKVSVYAISSLLAGIAGLIETARLGASDTLTIGSNIEIDTIAATVVGGTSLTGGSAAIVGTLIGVLIMQVINISCHMNHIDYAWSLVIKAAIILIAVYIQRPQLA
jgi:galactofuranose transport system permease protein